MLVLTRRIGESILIGDSIAITVVALGNGRVKLGIEAPRDMKVLRAELPPLIETPAAPLPLKG